MNAISAWLKRGKNIRELRAALAEFDRWRTYPRSNVSFAVVLDRRAESLERVLQAARKL